MKVYCWCPDGPGPLVGSPIDPVSVAEYQGELVQIHYACAPENIKSQLGCPCDCHRTVNEAGEVMLYWCSFCPDAEKCQSNVPEAK